MRIYVQGDRSGKTSPQTTAAVTSPSLVAEPAMVDEPPSPSPSLSHLTDTEQPTDGEDSPIDTDHRVSEDTGCFLSYLLDENKALRAQLDTYEAETETKIDRQADSQSSHQPNDCLSVSLALSAERDALSRELSREKDTTEELTLQLSKLKESAAASASASASVSSHVRHPEVFPMADDDTDTQDGTSTSWEQSFDQAIAASTSPTPQQQQRPNGQRSDHGLRVSELLDYAHAAAAVQTDKTAAEWCDVVMRYTMACVCFVVGLAVLLVHS
ncbi:unnamed protein product [Vitrella brassicaformis CCMP3155]|uniref:Uncharacterized protein n=1 Tax=Vitrella brassicaformis (strain CCMP3155) TaxID=1169540 RepID=A0A0G4FBC0_VITBC|nr:unnamed protein product [Vitrella brassicaformis CCMP3155]|eukprot:CEM10190.1 unnamed protein product [Vitrella brassicaformis CCMP3155]